MNLGLGFEMNQNLGFCMKWHDRLKLIEWICNSKCFKNFHRFRIEFSRLELYLGVLPTKCSINCLNETFRLLLRCSWFYGCLIDMVWWMFMSVKVSMHENAHLHIDTWLWWVSWHEVWHRHWNMALALAWALLWELSMVACVGHSWLPLHENSIGTLLKTHD